MVSQVCAALQKMTVATLCVKFNRYCNQGPISDPWELNAQTLPARSKTEGRESKPSPPESSLVSVPAVWKPGGTPVTAKKEFRPVKLDTSKKPPPQKSQEQVYLYKDVCVCMHAFGFSPLIVSQCGYFKFYQVILCLYVCHCISYPSIHFLLDDLKKQKLHISFRMWQSTAAFTGCL